MEAALIIAGAIWFHASIVVDPHTSEDSDVVIPFLVGLILTLTGLLLWIFQ